MNYYVYCTVELRTPNTNTGTSRGVLYYGVTQIIKGGCLLTEFKGFFYQFGYNVVYCTKTKVNCTERGKKTTGKCMIRITHASGLPRVLNISTEQQIQEGSVQWATVIKKLN